MGTLSQIGIAGTGTGVLHPTSYIRNRMYPPSVDIDEYFELGRFGLKVGDIWSILAKQRNKDPYLQELEPLSPEAEAAIQAEIDRRIEDEAMKPVNGQLMVGEQGMYVYHDGSWKQIVPTTYENLSDKLETWTNSARSSLHRSGNCLGEPISYRSTRRPASGDRDVQDLDSNPT